MKSTNITWVFEYDFAPISLVSVHNSLENRLDRNLQPAQYDKPTLKSYQNGTIT